MGIYDRDYYRRPATSSVGRMHVLSVTTWLIVINVAVFVVDAFLFQNGRGVTYMETLSPLFGLGYFSLSTAIGNLEIWRFITFQFLHANVMHLAFNMFALFFFGPFIESFLGRRRFLAFYLLCGVGGPIAYLVLLTTKVLVVSPATPMIGASASIFGVLIAAARIAPNTVVLIYGVFPMQLKTLAWVLLAIAAFTVLRYGNTGQHNAGGEAAHLGGAAVGWLLIHNPHWLQFPNLNVLRRRPPF
jgi:membrane associated rhomboid family serine protease